MTSSLLFSENLPQHYYSHPNSISNQTDIQTHCFAGGEGRRGCRMGPASKHRPDRRKGKEHTKGSRGSTKEKHEKGSSRKQQQEKRSNEKPGKDK